MQHTIVVTGGGTGGHLSIAKAIIDDLNQRNINTIFIGSNKGADKDWFYNYDKLFKKYFLNTRGVVNQHKLGKIVSLFRILMASFYCIGIFKKHKVTKVISVGGFSASPASIASIITRTHLYIHEQNSIMGKLNKLSSPFAKEVFSSYENNTIKIDYPINNELFNSRRIRTKLNTIIFLGGSQGSIAINKLALELAPILNSMKIKIIHQAGNKHADKMIKHYKDLNIDVDCFGFTHSLLQKLTKADVAVCRSGAGTVWELCALAIPAIYIPYPHAAQNHQYHNAYSIAKLGYGTILKEYGTILKEKEINTKRIINLFKEDLKYKSEGLKKLINPNGLTKMINIILN